MEASPRRFRGGTGRPLVLLHAATLTWRLWTPLLERLTAEREVLAPTLPGHLGGPPTPPDRGAFLDALASELDEAGFKQPDVVGNSLGGFAALELARRGRARRVVVIGPVGMQTPEQFRAIERNFLRNHRLGRLAGPLAGPGWAGGPLRRLFLREMVVHAGRVPRALAAELMAAAIACDLPGVIDVGRGSDGRIQGIGNIEEIRAPVLLLWGSRDRLVSRDQMDRYAAALPDVRFVEISGVGHCPQLEEPDRIADEILAFTDLKA